MEFIKRRLLQTATAGVAMGLLTLGATAQMDTETESEDLAQPPSSESIEQDEQQEEQAQGLEQLGEEADRESSSLKIGTIDLAAVSEAYKKQQGDRSLQAPAESGEPSPQAGEAGEDGAQEGELGGEAGAETGADGQFQDPQQQDHDPLGGEQAGQHSSEGGIDQQMIDEVRRIARQVADEQDVDLVVLEVLHEDSADVETIDLTSDVIAQLNGEEQDPMGLEPEGIETESGQTPGQEGEDRIDEGADDAAGEDTDAFGM